MKCVSYIGGEWCEQDGAPLVELGNPADQSEIISVSVHASADDALRALRVANSAWQDWKQMPIADRAALLDDLLEALVARKDEFAAGISAETGKTLREAMQEVDAAATESRAQIALFRTGPPQTVDGHRVRYEALGVVLLVTPSNFPLAAVLRKMLPALLAGNTVVVKTSELTPLTSMLLFEVLHASGFAPGVANLLLADGPAVVAALIADSGIKAVSMTGSNATGAAIAQAIGDRNIRLQAEMGGSNAVVILADADLQLAADAVLDHGFACCGQWCTGTSRVIVEEPVLKEFTGLLLQRVKAIAVGRGDDPATDMGPLISGQQRTRVQNAVAALREDGAEVLCGGRCPEDSELQSGFFFEPTVLLSHGEAGGQGQEEIFGPVVVLAAAANAEDALAKANDSRFGLSFSVFTADMELAERFVAGVEAGLCHVNLGTGVRDSALPLLGWKESGRGVPECGTFARDFYTRTKAVYRAGR